ncbi:hypothetical protein IWQ56_006708, partial [Coemansia nantahalensis]
AAESPSAEPPAVLPEQAADEAAEALGKLAVSDEKPARSESGTDTGLSAPAAPSKKQKQPAAQKHSGKSASKQHGKSAPAAKKQPEATPSAKADRDTKEDAPCTAAAGGVPEARATPVASPAPWSSAATGSARKQPRKSLLQIQQEEEEEATRRRQQAAKEQRALDASSQRASTSYADRLGASSGAPQPSSLAAIMEEQYRESAAADSAASAHAAPSAAAAPRHNGRAPHGASAQPSAAAPNTSPSAKTAAPVAKAGSDGALPSMEFLQWCHAHLGSLRGVNPCKFIEMLLTFPVPAPEATLEIISEQ